MKTRDIEIPEQDRWKPNISESEKIEIARLPSADSFFDDEDFNESGNQRRDRRNSVNYKRRMK